MPLETDFLFPDSSAVMWLTIVAIATPVVIVVLVLVLLRLLLKRAGNGLPVVFDAANPAHVDIDWEHAPRPIDMAAGAAQALADQLNQRPPS